ncbi:MAG: WYL domain-containing protein [Clostridia bacterium]|nr:WYL domain-containing protein [Clostridia bacterium]
MSEKKNVSFYALEILKKYSSMEKRLTKSKITRLISDEYGMDFDQRTVKVALEALVSLGYPIKYTSVFKDETEHKSQWYIEKPFSKEESGALLLAISSSSLITPDIKEALKRKLNDYLIGYEFVEGIKFNEPDDKSENKYLWSINVIYNAINNLKMLSFSILSYFYDEYKRFEEQNGRVKEYLVKPISVVCYDGSLYLFGELGDTENYRYFNIRKLYDLKETDVSFESKPIKTPLPQNRLEACGSYFGERETATILVSKAALSSVYEMLAPLCKIKCIYAEKAEIEVSANLKLLKPFILSLGSEAEVLSPTKLRRSLALEAQSVSAKYGEVRRLKGYFL